MIAAIIVLRDKATLSVDGTNYTIPSVPNGWHVSVTEWGDSGWISVRPRGEGTEPVFFVRMMIDGADAGDPTRAVWLVTSTGRGLTRLKNLASNSPRAWTIRGLRNDSGAVATAIKQAWKDARPRRSTYDQEGNPTGTEIIPDHAGTALVALRATIAGYDLHIGSEDYESVSSIPNGED